MNGANKFDSFKQSLASMGRNSQAGMNNNYNSHASSTHINNNN